MENKGFVTFSLAWTTKRHARVLHSGVAEHVKARLEAACVDAGWELRSLSLRLASVRLQVTVGPHVSAHHVVTTLKAATSRHFFQANPTLKSLPCLWTRSYFAASVGTVSEYEITRYIEQERRKIKQAQFKIGKKVKSHNVGIYQ